MDYYNWTENRKLKAAQTENWHTNFFCCYEYICRSRKQIHTSLLCRLVLRSWYFVDPGCNFTVHFSHSHIIVGKWSSRNLSSYVLQLQANGFISAGWWMTMPLNWNRCNYMVFSININGLLKQTKYNFIFVSPFYRLEREAALGANITINFDRGARTELPRNALVRQLTTRLEHCEGCWSALHWERSCTTKILQLAQITLSQWSFLKWNSPCKYNWF